MPQSAGYQIVRLANGACCVRSLAFDETFHPGVGPAAEAEALYVRQVRLIERARQYAGEFVIWDVGLGAAANVLAVLRATREVPCALRLISFDFTLEPLEFALQHRESLGYFHGYESPLERLLREHCVSFQCGPQDVQWELRLSDFPTLLAQPGATVSGACPVGAGVIDHVGYGTTSNCATQWGGTTETLTNTTAAFRKDDGCRNVSYIKTPASFRGWRCYL